MKAVVQRVRHARVRVDGAIVGEIGPGMLVLLGIGKSDTREEADYLAAKIAGLRIFNDSEGRMNAGLADVGGAVLAISQFTLYGDTRRGRRPGFDAALPPAEARDLYQYFLVKLRSLACGPVAEGQFQAHMEVELLNDGPVTLICESPVEWKGVKTPEPAATRST